MSDDLDRLERLGRLRQQGVLTDEEFQAQKAKLLARGVKSPPKWRAGSWGAAAILLVIIGAVLAASLSTRLGIRNSADEESRPDRSVRPENQVTAKSLAAPPAKSPPAALTTTKHAVPPRPRNQGWTTSEKQLVDAWYDANGRCRGGTDPERVEQACAERDGALARRLAAANICYGREGEYGYQMRMHRCGRGSLRMTE
jgi:hypothetical protein